jgi:predicted DNA repair protein MutK
VLGGLFLAYEGAEKIYEYFFPHKHIAIETIVQDFTEEEILALEKEKIKSAIVTDFILSVEIVIIALGTVIEESLTSQIVVVSIIAILATIGVYGIVALIVRMDDMGLKLIGQSTKEHSLSKTIGNLLVQALPKVIKSLAVIGTIALILVAGGIFAHNIDFLHHLFPQLPSIVKEFSLGLIIGFIVLGMVTLFKKVFKKNDFYKIS